jgi:DnaJ-domain-containing protein 1
LEEDKATHEGIV